MIAFQTRIGRSNKDFGDQNHQDVPVVLHRIGKLALFKTTADSFFEGRNAQNIISMKA